MLQTNLITGLQHPNPKIRKNAEITLSRFEKTNQKLFLFDLSKFLVDENIKSEIRIMSGILIKNKIGTFSQKKKNIKKLFRTLKNLKKKGIESNFLKTFNSSSENARKISAQIVARIIQIELLVNNKSEMMQTLINILITSNFEEITFQTVLQTIQYLYQDVAGEKISINLFDNISSEILRIVLFAINQNHFALFSVKIKGLITLNEGIGLISKFLNNVEWKQFIFKSIIDLFHTNNCEVIRQLTFELFEKIASDYYFYLEKHIAVLFEMTIATLNYQEELPSAYAIEFWSNISEKEYEISINNYQARQEGWTSNEYSFSFIKQVGVRLPYALYYIIREHKQCIDDSEWNKRTAALSCLNLICQTNPLDVIKHLFPFFISDLEGDYSRDVNLEGKILTFGVIFDGLGSKMLYQIVQQILPSLVFNFKNLGSTNGDFSIRHATAWLVGKIESITPYSLRETATGLIRLLFRNVTSAEVFDSAFYSLNRIFISFGKEGVLDWCYEGIFSFTSICVLVNIENSFNQFKIHELLEMLCCLTLTSSIREKAFIYTVIPFMFLKFKEIIYLFGKVSYFGIQIIQIQLCRFLNITVQKFWRKINHLFIQQVLEFLNFLYRAANNREAEWFIEEETIIFIGITANMSEKKFFFLLKNWLPFLLNCVINFEDLQISSLSITVLGDIIRNFGRDTDSFVPKIIDILSGKLKNTKINWNIKSPIIECLGDISFTKYFSWCRFMKFIMPFFHFNAFFSRDTFFLGDLDFFDNIIQIKESLGDSISSILSNFCFHYSKKKNPINIFSWLDEFIYKIILENRNERLIIICIGLIGDLNKNIPSFKKIFLGKKWVHQLMFETKYNKEEKFITTGNWTRNSLSK